MSGAKRQERQRRVVDIQDLSCVGRCSLAVSLPVLAAFGIEVSPLPTALLSTHTAFPNARRWSLTEEMWGIVSHWEAMSLPVDAVLTGYLGTDGQLPLAAELAREYRSRGALVVVDPVMGDNGRLYTGFAPGYAREMAALCGQADVILPNVTEAAFLLGEPCLPDAYTLGQATGLLRRLGTLGAKQVVLTGVCDGPDRLGVLTLDTRTDAEERWFHQRVRAGYPGTGDLFASVFTGLLLGGDPLPKAAAGAAAFVAECLRRTVAAGTDPRFGVRFEPCLPLLWERRKM